jgi:Ala-tRNA(Pro) deacylase
MPARELKELLDSHNVGYTSIYHSAFYTAQEIAASAHIAGKILAKTIIVKLDGKMAMIVLPGDRRVDLLRVKEASGAQTVDLAKEEEFRERFVGCHIGAMPPFGNLYGMAVFADRSLTENEWIVFNAGTHYELIKMHYRDFERLVKPQVGFFSLKLKA